jgi:hypothetical protein
MSGNQVLMLMTKEKNQYVLKKKEKNQYVLPHAYEERKESIRA